jgi:hypothetical protein
MIWYTPLRESLCVLGGHAMLVAIERCGVDGGSGVYGPHFLKISPIFFRAGGVKGLMLVCTPYVSSHQNLYTLKLQIAHIIQSSDWCGHGCISLVMIHYEKAYAAIKRHEWEVTH